MKIIIFYAKIKSSTLLYLFFISDDKTLVDTILNFCKPWPVNFFMVNNTVDRGMILILYLYYRKKTQLRQVKYSFYMKQKKC